MKLSEVLAVPLLLALGITGHAIAAKNSKKRVAAKSAFTKSSVRSKPLLAGPPRQAVPSSDRYKEIQGALVSKGYMTDSPTGVWNQQSIDAMKHYQADQKLDPTGRVNARSLITLGLGPKDESLPSSPAVPGK